MAMMRKALWRKIDDHEKALDGHGVIIRKPYCISSEYTPALGRIFRLAVTHDGWCRVCCNKFDIESNTVNGACIEWWDYETPEEAVAHFERLKKLHWAIWREDDRVLYEQQ